MPSANLRPSSSGRAPYDSRRHTRRPVDRPAGVSHVSRLCLRLALNEGVSTMSQAEADVGQVPKWLTKLEEQRERRLKVKLGHETGAGAPCLTCGDKCPGLDLHFWRKICKNCKCGKESHDVVDDDIYGYAQFQLLGQKPQTQSKKIVLPGKKEAVDLEWTPKGASTAVEKYLGELPPELLPVKGTEAAKERKQRLLKQMPAHDIDPALCHALTPDEIEKFLEYVAHIKQNSVGQGHITQLSLLRGQLHYMRPAGGQLITGKLRGDLTSSEDVPQAQTADGLARKLQQNVENLRDINLNAKQKRTGIYSNEDMDDIAGQLGQHPTLPHYAPGSYKTYENQQHPVNMPQVRQVSYDINVNPSLQRPKDLKLAGAQQGWNYVPNQNRNVMEHVQNPTEVKYNAQEWKHVPFPHPDNATTHGAAKYDQMRSQEYANQNANFPGGYDVKYGTQGPIPHAQEYINANVRFPEGYDPKYGTQEANLRGQGFGNVNAGFPEEKYGMGGPNPQEKGLGERKYGQGPYPQGQVFSDEKYGPQGANSEDQGFPEEKYGPPGPNSQGQGFTDGKYGMQGPNPQGQVFPEGNYANQGPNLQGQAFPEGYDPKSGLQGQKPGLHPQSFCANPNANVSEYQRHPAMETLTSIRDLAYPTSEIRSAVYYNEDLEAPELPKSDPRDLENSNLFTIPQCHKCKLVFEPDEIVISIERTDALWHTDCFKCETCDQILADLVYFYHKKTDKVYCGRDYAQIKGIPRCQACDELIFVNEYCLAEGSTFHVKHFCCFECDTPLAGQQYVMEGSQPLCLPCFDACKAEKCHTCSGVIHPDQQGANLNGVHFHVTPECFCCKECKKSLIGGKVMFKMENLFCSGECFQKHG